MDKHQSDKRLIPLDSRKNENDFEISATGYGLQSVEETGEENKDRETGMTNPSCGGL